ncbi:MAG: YdeI/OmpD-associated family protein [Paludibacter sp.]
MIATFFATQSDFRFWLEQNSDSKTELLVGFYKVNSGKPSLTWSESVDQALCFGWIDGIRKSIDNESYCIRFTPRRKNSIWSDINIKKVEDLTKAGLMTEAGLIAFSYRKEQKSGIYSFENKIVQFDDVIADHFKQNKLAWDYFYLKTPSFRKTITHWIMSAKQEKTRLLRLEKVMEDLCNART